MNRRLLLATACSLYGLRVSRALAQDTPAAQPLGFAVRLVRAGRLSTKVSSIVVTDVQAGSPAAAAGLQVGDEVIRVQDIDVPGADAFALRPHMRFAPGEPKTLRLRRPNGEEYSATLTRGEAQSR